MVNTGLDKKKKKTSVKLQIFSHPSILTFVLGAQKTVSFKRFF